MTAAPQTFADGGLILQRDGTIATLTFNNPAKRNAMTFAMWRDLASCLGDLARDDTLRCVVLTGAGDRAFVSGADISEFETKRGSADAITIYNAAVANAGLAIEAMPVPVIAAIRGACIGGGMGIALRCDLRLCSTDARFGIPAARLGLGYGFADLSVVVAAIGAQSAADMLFTARFFDSAEALACGLVMGLRDPSDVVPAAMDMAAGIATNAPLTVRAAKAGLLALRSAADPVSRAQAVAKVEAMVNTCFASADYAEGRTAFAARRSPNFKGE